MRPVNKHNRAALRDWMFLMTALAISLAGIGTYVLFRWRVQPAVQQEVLNDRSPLPLPAGPRNQPKEPAMLR
jgi:hypothetical protein